MEDKSYGQGISLYPVFLKEDRKTLLPILEALAAKGVRFGEGTLDGTDAVWGETLAESLSSAKAAVVFLSSTADGADSIRRALAFVLDRAIPAVAVYLDESEPSRSVKLHTDALKTLCYADFPTHTAFAEALYETDPVKECAGILTDKALTAEEEAEKKTEDKTEEAPTPDSDAAALNREGTRLYREKRYGEAYTYFLKAAKAGSSHGAYNTGLCRQNGQGVEKNEFEAARWFLTAAEGGHALAQYKLGHFYQYGKGVVMDLDTAHAWYLKAADNGSPEAMYALGGLYQNTAYKMNHNGDAMRWYRAAAENGHAAAKYAMGLIYECGEAGKQDDTAAYNWYKMSAEQGYAPAQHKLGVFYKYGRGGLKKSHENAFYWNLKAAEGGLPEAMYSVADSYLHGKGVREDASAAYRWYVAAARNGHKSAIRLCKSHHIEF